MLHLYVLIKVSVVFGNLPSRATFQNPLYNNENDMKENPKII